jgi:hypothetical protein
MQQSRRNWSGSNLMHVKLFFRVHGNPERFYPALPISAAHRRDFADAFGVDFRGNKSGTNLYSMLYVGITCGVPG